MTETTTGRASASLRWTLSAKGADLASSTRLAAQPDLALQPVALPVDGLVDDHDPIIRWSGRGWGHLA